MKLEYGTILCPEPITLSIGTIRNPKLREIGKITFEKFGYYEDLLKLTPALYYTRIKGDDGAAYWNSLSDEEKEKIDLYDIIISDDKLIMMYTEIFNFFFIEPVIFREGFFILLKEDIEDEDAVVPDKIRGVIAKELLPQVLNLLQQICCINEEEEKEENLKFKNNLAKRLYEKMAKAKKESKNEKKKDINMTLPNIISSVSNRHLSINPINVWDMTIFQLLDSFNRTQINTMYDIDATRVSVWGDEKKTFDISLWYKNEYDNT